MSSVEIVRFCSDFQGGVGTLAAELSSAPNRAWREQCRSGLVRYTSAFGHAPELTGDELVVAVEVHELALAEAALRHVVAVANCHTVDLDPA
jgi:hypothetical protein